ncbi:MAG TPA: hypothetical protein VLG16_01050 [Candidatus Saccharimonadales bacterium]|nr:hypothetical protein [Candidatus Saccharimonadales bacterium]
MHEQHPSSDPADVNAFLASVNSGEIEYSFSYIFALQDKLKEPTQPHLPNLLADLILEAPLDNSTWEATYQFKVGSGQQIYTDIALIAFSRAVLNTEVAYHVADRLVAADPADTLPRLDKVSQSVFARVLNTTGSSIEACARVWASVLAVLSQAETPLQIPSNGLHALQQRTAEELVTFQAILYEQGYPQVSQALEEMRLAKEQHAAAEAAAEAERQRQADLATEQNRRREARVVRISEEPFTAFDEFSREIGLTQSSDFAALSPVQLGDLALAAHKVLESRIGIDDPISNRQDLVELASQLLDHLVNLRRAGQPFDYRDRYYIDHHEQRPVIHAQYEADFWTELAKYAEWTPHLTPTNVGELYETWKNTFIEERKYQQALAVMTESGRTIADFIPEGCTNIEVAPYGGSVIYNDIEQLLCDMRRYYVPRSDHFDSFAAAARQIITSAGVQSGYTSYALERIHELIGISDQDTMDRIEAEIRNWLTTDMQQEYRDSRDNRGGGDPYKYEITTFAGQGISIQHDNGQFALHIVGRGHNRSPHNPARFIEDFAFVAEQDVTYGNGLQITYTASQPETIEIQSEVADDPDSQRLVKVEVPLGNILLTLDRTLSENGETVIDNIDEIARLVTDDNRYPAPTFQLGAYTASVKLGAWDMVYNPTTKKAVGSAPLFHSQDDGYAYHLPETKAQVTVTVEIPGAFQRVALRVLAARTLLHSQPNHNRQTRTKVSAELLS